MGSIKISWIIEAQLHSCKRTTRVTGFNTFSHEDDSECSFREESHSAYTGRLQYQTIKRVEQYIESSGDKTNRQIV